MIFEVLVFRIKTKTSKPFSGRFNTPVANPVQPKGIYRLSEKSKRPDLTGFKNLSGLSKYLSDKL